MYIGVRLPCLIIAVVSISSARLVLEAVHIREQKKVLNR